MPTQTLELPQLVELNDVLVSAFDVSGFRIVLASINKDLDTISTASGTENLFFEVLKAAQREGWVNDLAIAAHNRNPTHPDLCAFIREHLGDEHLKSECLAVIAASGDPFAIRFLRSNRSLPFVNREELCRKLRGMFGGQNPPRIVGVDSKLSKCGKSYTYEKIRFLALYHNQRTVKIDIDKEFSANFGSEDLARLLGDKIGANMNEFPQRESMAPRWNKELCRWLLHAINASGKFWWIVIDGINQVSNLSTDLHDFVHELALQVEDEDDPNYRLVLISYNTEESLPIQIRGRAEQDIIEGPIGFDELKSFFSKEVEQFRMSRGLSEVQVNDLPDTLADWVIQKMDSDDYTRDQRLYALGVLIPKAMDHLEALIGPINGGNS